MNIRDLCRIADGKSHYIPKGSQRNNVVKDFFDGDEGSISGMHRVSDKIAQDKIADQSTRIKKLRDQLDEKNKKISNLEKSLEEKKKESSSVEEFFKKELEEKDQIIRNLTESLLDLQSEEKTTFTYDILTEEFKAGDFIVKLEPEIAKILANILTRVPNTKLNSNMKVKDGLSTFEVRELKDFVAVIEKALDGDIEPLEEFDISNLPEDLLALAKAIKTGKPYISHSDYEELVPVLKGYLVQENIKFPSLALIADSSAKA